MADSPVGVRVVSIEESSQAHLSDLRSDDVIVQVRGTEVHSIDDFAQVSDEMKGRTISTTLLVFRNGAPVEVTIHLYSYPILQAWGVRFVPDYDVRFADGPAGFEYWGRLGRGFEGAGKPKEALNAYLNALHNMPDQPEAALKASSLFAEVSRERLAAGAPGEGIAHLRQSLAILERLFAHPLSDAQLDVIRAQLRSTLEGLRRATLKTGVLSDRRSSSILT